MTLLGISLVLNQLIISQTFIRMNTLLVAFHMEEVVTLLVIRETCLSLVWPMSKSQALTWMDLWLYRVFLLPLNSLYGNVLIKDINKK